MVWQQLAAVNYNYKLFFILNFGKHPGNFNCFHHTYWEFPLIFYILNKGSGSFWKSSILLTLNLLRTLNCVLCLPSVHVLVFYYLFTFYCTYFFYMFIDTPITANMLIKGTVGNTTIKHRNNKRGVNKHICCNRFIFLLP